MKITDIITEAATPAQQAAIAIAKKKKAGVVKEQQLDEFAPLLAAGARLFMAAAPKIAQVVGRAGQAGARGAGQAARAGTEIAAKNAGKIGMGAGAYEIGSSVADIAKDIAAKVGTAIDEKTLLDLSALAFKYAIPAGIVLAVLYGGKKAIDSLFDDPKDQQGVAEGYQLDEGAIETITALAKKIPGIGKYYQMAQQYKPQLIEILKTSKSGKEVKQKMEQLAAGQSATVAESGMMKQLGGLAVGGGSILSTMWMNAMGMIDGVLAHAAAGEVGGAVASGSILGLIPITLMLFAAMLMFKGSKQSSDEKAQAFQAQRGQQGVAEEASPMIKPPANRFDNKQEAFAYAKEHGGKVFKSTYIDPNTGNKNITFVVKKDQGVAEGSESDAYGNTGEKHECGSCDGTGIVSYDELAKAVEYDDVCPECGGKGWVRDKESSKKKGVAEHTELAEEFDLIESIVEMIAEHNGVDADVVWEDLESLTEDELYVFAVTSDPLMEDWQKANKRDRTDGMSQKAVNAYRRENPGSKLKTAVTTKPGKLKKGGKASKRRKSYCSRSRGQMKMHSISCAKTPDKAICKARRRWNC